MTAASLYLICFLTLVSCGASRFQPFPPPYTPSWVNAKQRWNFKRFCSAEMKKVESLVHIDRIRNHILPGIMMVRFPGSRGNKLVQQVIANITGGILGWNVEYDHFTAFAPAPYGLTEFTNVIATHNPAAKRRLVLACHYDSKITPTGFLGAIDSAVPCSMMIEIAIALRNYLSMRNDLTLELIFFDGEEAFVEWSNSDSLYGSRNLADKWQKEPWPPRTRTNYNRLQSIDLLVLLDLIGAPNPQFFNSLLVPSTHFDHLVRIEKSLNKSSVFFQPAWSYRYVEDDHLPFYRKHVPILHVIPNKFPTQWHTLADTTKHLDYNTIERLTRIFAVFVAEYLHLDLGVSQSECAKG